MLYGCIAGSVVASERCTCQGQKCRDAVSNALLWVLHSADVMVFNVYVWASVRRSEIIEAFMNVDYR